MSWLKDLSSFASNSSQKRTDDAADWRTSTLKATDDIREERVDDMKDYKHFKRGLRKSTSCGRVRGSTDAARLPGVISGHIMIDARPPPADQFVQRRTPIIDVERYKIMLRRISADEARVQRLAERLEELNRETMELRLMEMRRYETFLVDSSRVERKGLIPYLRRCFGKVDVLKKIQSALDGRRSGNSIRK